MNPTHKAMPATPSHTCQNAHCEATTPRLG